MHELHRLLHKRLRTILSASAATMLFACSGSDARNATGSQALVASQDFSLLYVTNVDNGSVSRFDPATKATSNVQVGLEPTRIARAGGNLFVTIRGERKVSVLRDDGGLEVVSTIDVGSEPVGIVSSPDETKLFVASSLSGTVDEIDVATQTITRSFKIGDEPRWLAVHPSGTSLYVASAFRGTLTRVDLESGATSPIVLPTQQTFDFMNGTPVQLSTRLTGDPAVSPGGDVLAVPTLYVDNTSVVAQNAETAPSGYDAGRMNPVVALIPLDGDGVPTSDPIETVRVSSFNEVGPIVGYPSSVTFSPDGELVLATIEGGGSVLAFETEAPDPGLLDQLFGNAAKDIALPGPSFSFRNVVGVETDAGPRGIQFLSDDKTFVYGFLDRTVSEIDVAKLRDQFDGSSGAVPMVAPSPAVTSRTPKGVELEKSALPSEVEFGRRLFYSTADARMTSVGSGVSCGTCHFDGRDDGLVWRFDRGPRQTPSLAGKVSLTAPVGWQGQQPTVADDAMSTSQSLMGGTGMGLSEADAIAAYIDFTRDLDLPRSKEDAAALRGKEIFEREAVGCATCHAGERLSDNQLHVVRGVSMKTRPLRNVAATPPYFHDGSVTSLRDVVLRARDGAEGNTADLSDAEIDDLVAFLETL